METKRLNKAISETGFCSRRAADRYIEEGKVMVNGEVAGLGVQVTPEDIISVDGQIVAKTVENIYLAFNKPEGITCTTDRSIRDNIVDCISHRERIFHIGRLDKDSEGLIFMTNDGDIVNKILRASNNHEKEYIVEVDRKITRDFIEGMAAGVPILDTITNKCKVERIDNYSFRIILTQGLNRQIRRMCSYFDYEVLHLQRVRIMNIELGDLRVGEYRSFTKEELEEILRLVEDSTKTYDE